MGKKLKKILIAGNEIRPGERTSFEIAVAKLFDYTEITIPVEIVRGKDPGPVLFVSAAVHGDEINGVEIIKRLLGKKKILKNLSGTLIAVPIVNAFGFNRNIRYLPDRRDLNRCFPGSPGGSLGSRIAHTFINEIVTHCTHGIDLHTGSNHRKNLPQIRAHLESKETEVLAREFGVPVVINADLRDGSLRHAVTEMGLPMLLFEGGEALRYDEKVIRAGLSGILSVMSSLGMLENGKRSGMVSPENVFVAHSSFWVRSPHSGSVRIKKHLGARVEKGETLGVISNPFGKEKIPIESPETGIIIGLNLLPLVNNGDAIFHIARFEDIEAVENSVENFDEIFEEVD